MLRIKSFGNVSLQDSDSESSEDESGGIVQTHTEGGFGAHHNVPTACTVPTARVIEGESVVCEIELFLIRLVGWLVQTQLSRRTAAVRANPSPRR